MDMGVLGLAEVKKGIAWRKRCHRTELLGI